MPRRARVVVPGVPHHVTQRGSRRQQVFFGEHDYRYYLELLGKHAARNRLMVWTYCLMPNHIHLIGAPDRVTGLAGGVGKAHQLYAAAINRREGWTGHLWQERFSSFPMDDRYLYSATRYVLLNPVRAGLAERPEQWPYSSARAHLYGINDLTIDPSPLAKRIGDWDELLSPGAGGDDDETLREHARSGRPLGNREFLRRLQRVTGQDLGPRRLGRPPKVH